MKRAQLFLYTAWITSMIASIGSLFFSEVMKFAPCVMCWYQRICMYPLVIVLIAGMFPLDRNIFKYALPLAGLGWVIAIYHNLLTWGIIPASAAPCQQGVSCATVYIQWAGFISIPVLSFTAFTIILICLFMFKKEYK